MATSELDTNQKARPGSHFGHIGRVRLELHNLAVLSKVRNRTGLGHKNRVTPAEGQTSWNDIVERFYYADLSIQGDRQDPVEMSIRYQETTFIGLQSKQDAGIYEEGKRNGRRIVQIKLPDVSDNRELLGPSTR